MVTCFVSSVCCGADITGRGKDAYFRELFLELLRENVNCEFQVFHLLHWEGGVRQVNGAEAGPTVIPGAREIRKRL